MVDPGPLTGQRGVALLMVLWGVTLLAVVAGSLGYSLRSESRLTGNYLMGARAAALAEGGIYQGILALLEGRDETQWLPDGQEREVTAPSAGHVLVSLQAERGKVDLNQAPKDLVERLVLAVDPEADAEAVAGAIVDWRDPDDDRQPGGAEDSDYRAAGLNYAARDGPFTSVQELQQVLGVTPELYQVLRELVTVHGGQASVDPLVAPRTVLLALPGMDESAVEELLAWRESIMGEEGMPVLPPAAILGDLRLSPSQSGIYTVLSRGITPEGGRAGYRVVVRLGGNGEVPYTVLQWLPWSGTRPSDETKEQT